MTIFTMPEGETLRVPGQTQELTHHLRSWFGNAAIAGVSISDSLITIHTSGRINDIEAKEVFDEYITSGRNSVAKVRTPPIRTSR